MPGCLTCASSTCLPSRCGGGGVCWHHGRQGKLDLDEAHKVFKQKTHVMRFFDDYMVDSLHAASRRSRPAAAPGQEGLPDSILRGQPMMRCIRQQTETQAIT